jgi:hypothetical protein
MDRNGKPPSAEAFRKIFLRVQRDLGEAHAPTPSGPRLSAKTRPIPSPSPPTAPADQDDEPDDRPTFTPIRDRK